ncbi:MAG: hypothetical protein E6344_15555 [Clostridium sp.]|nr:hypothetical protein [Clostridium sp.]MDU7085111.1 hypothetical protein [Clostridium sp.]
MRIGYGIFGKAFEVMLRNDLHALESIDHEFLSQMILVDEESKELLYGTSPKISYDVINHELFEFAQRFKGDNELNTIRNVLNFTSNIAMNYDVNFLDMTFGGRERDIIERGTDWCADMARVGCVLLQCNNIPTRIVHIVDTEKAYHGHVVGEAFFEGGYGVCDFIFGVIGYDKSPISAWQMSVNRNLVTKCYTRDYTSYSTTNKFEGLFSKVAINEYNIMDKNNNFTESKPNDYTTRIITEDHNNWFMGEDM